MNRKLTVLVVMLALVSAFAFAQDLKIEYQLDVPGTSPVSYFTFTGPIRYIAVEKDHIDGSTGASAKKSTEIFQPYRYDVKGKNALPDALRGLFLFSVAPVEQRTTDNFTVTKAGNGTITINYCHRGTAYQLVTDRNGRFTFPNGEYRKRTVGFIQGEGPQVVSRDFSSDGTAAKIDWNKVWNSGIAGGKPVTSGSDKKTGNIESDGAAADSMFYWDGALQVALDRNLLKVSGGLNAVKR